jgi:hypothetical protein
VRLKYVHLVPSVFDGETDAPIKRFVRSKNDGSDNPTGTMVVIEPNEHDYDTGEDLEFTDSDPNVLEDGTMDDNTGADDVTDENTRKNAAPTTNVNRENISWTTLQSKNCRSY